MIAAYLEPAGLQHTPLFRSAPGKIGELSPTATSFGAEAPFHAIFLPSCLEYRGETTMPLRTHEQPISPRGFSLPEILVYVPLGQASRLCRGWKRPFLPRLLVGRPSL